MLSRPEAEDGAPELAGGALGGQDMPGGLVQETAVEVPVNGVALEGAEQEAES